MLENATFDQILQAMSWVLVALSLAGNIFVNKKNVIGQWMWLIANIGWIGFNIYFGMYSQAVLFGCYFMLCCWGIWSWSQDSKKMCSSH